MKKKKQTNKQTGGEGEKVKGGGGRATDYKPKSIARYKSAKQGRIQDFF